MNRMEQAALRHAAEWIKYSRSPQAKRDAAADKARRAKADRKAGHSTLRLYDARLSEVPSVLSFPGL